MPIEIAGGLPGLLWIGAVDGAEIPRLTEQTDEAPSFLSEVERQKAEALDEALLALLGKLVQAQSHKPRLSHVPFLSKVERGQENPSPAPELSNSADEEMAGDVAPRLSSVPLLTSGLLHAGVPSDLPELHSDVNANPAHSIRILPINRTPDLYAKNPTLFHPDRGKSISPTKAPALTNEKPTLFFEPSGGKVADGVKGAENAKDELPPLMPVGDDFVAPEGIKAEKTLPHRDGLQVSRVNVLPSLSDGVLDGIGQGNQTIATEDGVTVVLPTHNEPSHSDRDAVPSLFHGEGKKEEGGNPIPGKPQLTLERSLPGLVPDSVVSESPVHPRLISADPNLHSEKRVGEKKSSGGEQPSLHSRERKGGILPSNLTPALHSALKRYGRLVSASVLSLREYAQKLLTKGVSVEEIIKILNSEGNKPVLTSLDKEQGEVLHHLVQKVKGVVEGSEAEGRVPSRMDVAGPSLFSRSPVLISDFSQEGAREDTGDAVTPVKGTELGGQAEGMVSRPGNEGMLLIPPASHPVFSSGTWREPPIPLSVSPSLVHTLADRLAQFMESEKVKTLELHLDPPDLGRVHLTVHALGNRIDAEVSVSNGDVRHFLEAHRAEIVSALQNRGLELASLTVSSQGRQGWLGDYAPSPALVWSAPLPVSETPLLVGLSLSSSSGLDVRA